MLLIDTRQPPPPPKRPRGWSLRDLRGLLPFAAALALLFVAMALPPLGSYLAIIAACVLIGWGAARLVPGSAGLRDHRQ